MKHDVKLWREEFIRGGVPSSYRTEPSGAVVFFAQQFLSLMASRTQGALQGADLGCGRGRNSLYLAKCGYAVSSFDFVAENIDYVAQQNVHNVAAFCHDLTAHWPLEDSSQDFAIDIFCFKHFIEEPQRLCYKREMLRILKPGGLYLLTLAGDDDCYYAQYTVGQAARAAFGVNILDPANGIASSLYAKEEIVQFFLPLRLISYTHGTNDYPMHGTVYKRSTHQFVFAKDSPC